MQKALLYLLNYSMNLGNKMLGQYAKTQLHIQTIRN